MDKTTIDTPTVAVDASAAAVNGDDSLLGGTFKTPVSRRQNRTVFIKDRRSFYTDLIQFQEKIG